MEKTSKQEEIKEGVKDIIIDNSGNISCLYTEPRNLHVELCLNIADKILSYLHSQGVVIKVDRELPKIPIKAFENYKEHELGEKCRLTQRDMLKSGYVAVEALIREV